MIDSYDVLLLRPARSKAAFDQEHDRQPRSAIPPVERGFVTASILPVDAPADEGAVVAVFEDGIAPTVSAGGGSDPSTATRGHRTSAKTGETRRGADLY